MGKNQDVVLTTSDNDTELSNRFSDFFLGKIQTIRDNLRNANETNDNVVNVLRAMLNSMADILHDSLQHLVTRLGNFS